MLCVYQWMSWWPVIESQGVKLYPALSLPCSHSNAFPFTHIPTNTYPIHTFVITVGLSWLLVWKAACVYSWKRVERKSLENLQHSSETIPCMLPCPSVIQHLSVSPFTASFLLFLSYVLACLIYSMTWIYKPCFIRLVTRQTHARGGLIPLHSLFLPFDFVGQFDSLLLWLNGVILCCMSLNIPMGDVTPLQ